MKSLELINKLIEKIEKIFEDNPYSVTLSKEVVELIKQDLECLKKMNEVWHKHEVMESVDINENHLEELYSFNSRLIQENEKLKQALDKACEKFDYTCPVEEELIEDLDCDNCNNNCKECWKKYFLKEVLGNE